MAMTMYKYEVSCLYNLSFQRILKKVRLSQMYDHVGAKRDNLSNLHLSSKTNELFSLIDLTIQLVGFEPKLKWPIG